MKKDQIENKIKQIFLKSFQGLKSTQYSIDKKRSSFENWDSLTHMQLVSEVESAFKVSFDMNEVIEINSPKDLANLVQKKLNVSK